jgi:hypothetical protein
MRVSDIHEEDHMITGRHVAAFIAAGSLLAVTGLAHGQAATPTQADFDRCNQLAQAAIGANPSASPSTIPPTAAPRLSSPAPLPPSAGTPAPGSGTPSATSDSQLRGMAAAGLTDPAYQAAYRDCLRSK